jgi:two-component system nitrogen regulation response regulator GlnG
VRRLAILYSDDVITADMVLQEFAKDLPQIDKVDEIQGRLDVQLEEACRTLLDTNLESDESVYAIALTWVEKPLIVEALRLTGGNRAKAADKLGIHRNTLRTRLKSLDID